MCDNHRRPKFHNAVYGIISCNRVTPAAPADAPQAPVFSDLRTGGTLPTYPMPPASIGRLTVEDRQWGDATPRTHPQRPDRDAPPRSITLQLLGLRRDSFRGPVAARTAELGPWRSHLLSPLQLEVCG